MIGQPVENSKVRKFDYDNNIPKGEIDKEINRFSYALTRHPPYHMTKWLDVTIALRIKTETGPS